MKWGRIFKLCISAIVDGTFDYYKIERVRYNKGKPPFGLKDMIKLIFHGYINKITGSLHLAREVEHNILYNMISHGLKLGDRTIRDYCKFFQPIYRLIISFMLIVANKLV